MYKVFLNDVPIILSTQENLGEQYTNFPIKSVKIKKIIKRIKKGELFYVNLYHKKEKKLIKFLKKKLKTISAGGGVVYNQHQEVLFIYRNGRWDLPKGGRKRGETMEETALREVEEETLVKNLQITKFLQITYHIMKRKGKYRLKETFWFEMKTDYEGKLIPQEEEGITKVKWKKQEKAQSALEKSYANIKELFPDLFQSKVF
ncbi:MAG: NUDIX hydrolase [Bacteroidota bacterium]